MEALKIVPKYLFGKNAIFGLVDELRDANYKKALILTGRSSYKTNGSFDHLIAVLNEVGLEYFHFEGIEPNPKHTTIDKCIELAISEGADVIFALGGGSVVDASKVIAVLTKNNHYKSSWDYVLKPNNVKNKGIDVISIITLAGTGSENNGYSVISNAITKEKKSVSNPSATPIISVQDPSYTFSVNAWHSASGIFDCFSHLLEQYFGKSTFEWTKEYIFANIRVLINYAKMVILRPTHYDARANFFWTSTMALNGLASFNCETDWSVHTIEHAMSGLWDITHGAGLAFITPTYLKIRAESEKWFNDKLIELGRKIFRTQTVDETVNFLTDFIKSINLPVRWSEFDEISNFTDEDAAFLLEHSVRFGDPSLKEVYEKVILALKEKK